MEAIGILDCSWHGNHGAFDHEPIRPVINTPPPRKRVTALLPGAFFQLKQDLDAKPPDPGDFVPRNVPVASGNTVFIDTHDAAWCHKFPDERWCADRTKKHDG